MLDDQPAPFPAATLAVRVNVLAEQCEREATALRSGLEHDEDGVVILDDSGDVANDAMAEGYSECAAALREALARSV